MKSPLLTALVIVTAASISGGEDSSSQKIAEAVAPLPTAFRDGAEIFTYDSDWQRTVLRAGTNSVRCHAPDSLSLAPVIRAQCFHRSWEGAMVRMTQLTATGMSLDDAFQTVVTEIESGKLKGPDAGAVLYELFAVDGLQGHANMAVATPHATPDSLGLPDEPDAYRPWSADLACFDDFRRIDRRGTPTAFSRRP